MKNDNINAVLEVSCGVVKLKNSGAIGNGYVLKPSHCIRRELGSADVYKSIYSANKYVRKNSFNRRG